MKLKCRILLINDYLLLLGNRHVVGCGIENGNADKLLSETDRLLAGSGFKNGY
jgi:hypothetical protein